MLHPRDPPLMQPINLQEFFSMGEFDNSKYVEITAAQQANLTLLVGLAGTLIYCCVILLRKAFRYRGRLREQLRGDRHEKQSTSRPETAQSPLRTPSRITRSTYKSLESLYQYGPLKPYGQYRKALFDTAYSELEESACTGFDPALRRTTSRIESYPVQTLTVKSGSSAKKVKPEPSLKGRGPSGNHKTSQDASDIVAGDWVLRIRPPHTILKGSCDENDLYDGPWKVLEVRERYQVCHTPMVRSSSRKTTKGPSNSIPSAKLALPVDSFLQKHSQGWVPLNQLVRSNSIVGEAVDGGEPAIVIHDGHQYYTVKKVRGMRMDYPPKKVGARSPVSGVRAYLVHWAGYPSEDDTWEKADTDQEGGVPPGYISEWKKRDTAWRLEPLEAEVV